MPALIHRRFKRLRNDNPIHLSETPVTYRCAAPTLGQDNAEILSELGLSADAQAALASDGVITQVPPLLPRA